MPPRAPRRVLDFRSDTVTQPTDAMRKAMADAVVGDDVYGEDPTVNKLQEEAARLVGMEAALFVPTGTMGNQIAAWVHTERRGAILAEEHSHIAYYEGGAASLISGAAVKTVQTDDGTFASKDLLTHLDATRDPHLSEIKMVSAENTVQWTGGHCWPVSRLHAARDYAHEHGAKFHIDGARLFNAAVAQKTSAAKICKGADSVMFCVSKGLSAPVGSLLCGSPEFIHEAHTARKCLGGGMRQAGHLAAAGLVALKSGIERLAEDHANAKLAGKLLGELPGVEIAYPVETNMAFMDVTGTKLGPSGFIAAAKKAGVLLTSRSRDSDPIVRLLTHRNVSADDVRDGAARLQKILA